jgi:hypothetical protein
MKRFAVVLLGVLMLAGCQTTGGDRKITQEELDGPVPPGVTRTKFSLNRDRWVRRANSTVPNIVVFDCRPLACEKPTVIIYANSPSSTRKPDIVALNEWAKLMQEKRKALGFEKMSYRLSSVHGYPATFFESTTSQAASDGKKTVSVDVNIFAENIYIVIRVLSTDRGVSKKYLDEAIKSLSIKDGGPRL